MIRWPTLSAAVAFVALAALPMPGAAQTGPCGPDGHTQTCLLEEAMILSGQRKRGVGDIQDMLAIASVAEASGRVDMSAFAPRFFARLEDRYPHGPVLLDLLDAKVCSGHGRGIGPVLATQMARRIPMLEREVTAEDRRILGKDFDRLHVVAVCLALAGDIDGLDALLAAHPDRASGLAGGAANRLMWLGEREAARDLMAPYDLAAWENKILTRHAIWRGALWRQDVDAVLEILDASETETSMHWRLREAHDAMSDPDHRKRLIEVARDLGSDVGEPLSGSVFTLLVKEPAQAGDWDETLALMARLDPAANEVRATTMAMARLAGATGTWEVVVDLIETHAPKTPSDGSRRWVHRNALAPILAAAYDAALAGRYGDLRLLVEKLAPQDHVTAYAEFGRAQVRAGHLTGAFATMRMLRALRAEVREVRSLLRELAVALAQAGQIEAAVGYARQLGEPVPLARVAVHAPH